MSDEQDWLHPKRIALAPAPPPGPNGEIRQKDYWAQDADDRGLSLRVSSKGSRTWSYLGRLDSKVRRFSLGKFPDMGLAAARERAAFFRSELKAKRDPAPKAQVKITLRTALESYKLDMAAEGKSDSSIRQYGYVLNKHLSAWMDKPLAEVAADPGVVKARHREITADNGPYMANLTFRVFRAVYTAALIAAPEGTLPAKNPVKAVAMNKEHRRKVVVDDYGAWWRTTEALDPTIRDFQRFLILSGSRPGAIGVSRVEHFHPERSALHCPTPKGGADRAFDLPLSPALVEIIKTRISEGNGSPWIFAMDNKIGRVDFKQTVRGLTPCNGKLRNVWSALARAAGVSKTDLKFIQNHSTRSDVSDGYANREDQLLFRRLCLQQELIGRFFFESAGIA